MMDQGELVNDRGVNQANTEIRRAYMQNLAVLFLNSNVGSIIRLIGRFLPGASDSHLL